MSFLGLLLCETRDSKYLCRFKEGLQGLLVHIHLAVINEFNQRM